MHSKDELLNAIREYGKSNGNVIHPNQFWKWLETRGYPYTISMYRTRFGNMHQAVTEAGMKIVSMSARNRAHAEARRFTEWLCKREEHDD